jgi:WD40 repeat protein
MAVAFSPDSQIVVSVSDDTTIQLWDARTGRKRFTHQQDHFNVVWTVAFSPNGQILAT